MKIIQLTGGKVRGGKEKFAQYIAAAFAAGDYDVETITKGGEAIDIPMRGAGLRVARMPLGGDFDFLTPVMLAGKIRKDASRCILLVAYTLREAAAAVKARTLVGDADRQIKIILIAAHPGDTTGSLRARRIYEAVDAHIFLSESGSESFRKAWPSVDKTRIHTVTPGIPLFSSLSDNSEAPAASLKKDNQPTILLYLGRIAEGKGLETLVRTLGRLGDLDLKLRIAGVGRGPYVAALKGEVWRNGVVEKVEWLSQLDDVKVQEEIRRADIGVVTAENPDTFGLALLELMSARKAVIATARGVHREVITTGEDGLLVPGGDSSALAEAIRELVTRPEKAQRLGEAAAARVEKRHTHGAMMREIIKITNALFA